MTMDARSRSRTEIRRSTATNEGASGEGVSLGDADGIDGKDTEEQEGASLVNARPHASTVHSGARGQEKVLRASQSTHVAARCIRQVPAEGNAHSIDVDPS